MKKEIKKTNSNVYPTIKKLSLSMTIIGWIASIMIIVGAILAILSIDPDTIWIICLVGGAGIGALASFIVIGQFVLNKKVDNVTPKITSKASTIVFAIAFALGLAGLIVLGIGVSMNSPTPIGFDGTSLKIDEILQYSGVGVFLIGYLIQVIMSTIIVAQIKVN